jgi:hypothetical protein
MGRRGDRELARMSASVRQQIEAGHQSFVVPVFCLADGRWQLEGMKRSGQQVLLDMGLNVTGMNYDDSNYTAYFEVQVPPQREAEKICPQCAEAIKAAALICRFCRADVANVLPLAHETRPAESRAQFRKQFNQQGQTVAVCTRCGETIPADRPKALARHECSLNG